MSEQMQNLTRQLTADKKKLGVMVLLLAVGLLLWGRLLLKQVPRTATADPARAMAASPGTDDAGDAGHAVTYEPLETVSVRLADALERDLFAFDAQGYRKSSRGADSRIEPKTGTGTPDVEFRIARAREAAEGVRLDSVVYGDNPRVVINGKLLAIGERIEEFTVVGVEERKVVLEMDGVRVKLGM